MIVLTRLNGVSFALNDELIETISENPDTTIHMTNKNIYIVKEDTQTVINKIVDYRRKVYSTLR